MKALRVPLALLAALLAACLINCRVMGQYTRRWQAQLAQSGDAARQENWSAARSALAAGYADWAGAQNYLHIVSEHAAVDGAEAMYRRATAFCEAEEPSEFQAELADLIHQLQLLYEMERPSLKNIL